MARKTKLTAEVRGKVLSAIKLAGTRTAAAKMAGVDRRTLHTWIQRGSAANAREPYRSFVVALRQAEGETQQKLSAVILRAAMGDEKKKRAADWHAADRLLQVVAPREWGQKLHLKVEEELEHLLDVAESVLPSEHFQALVAALADEGGEAAGSPTDD